MFLKALHPPAAQALHPHTTWHVCKLAHGESIVSVHEYDAFVITGSRFNIRDGVAGLLPWFEPLCELIRQVAGVSPPPPLPLARPLPAGEEQCVDALPSSPSPSPSAAVLSSAAAAVAAARASATRRRLYGACFGHQVLRLPRPPPPRTWTPCV